MVKYTVVHPDNYSTLSYQAVSRHTGNLPTHSSVNKSHLKRPNTVWYQLCGARKGQNYGQSEKLVVARSEGVGKAEKVEGKRF
jgi:hypothetical protein